MADPRSDLEAARGGDHAAFARLTEPFRGELRLHCYRLLGSLSDAEDVVQDTLIRAWQKLDHYEGRGSVRGWLHKIATHASLDVIEARPRRGLPTSSLGAADPNADLPAPITESVWLDPIPDSMVQDSARGPEALYDTRQSVALAFTAALQFLPARQRAILVLRDVLGWSGEEVAELLETTPAAVNGALMRARGTMANTEGAREVSVMALDDPDRALLARYMEAFEHSDPKKLVTMLHQDATMTMPPLPLWLHGRDAIVAFMARNVLREGTRGFFRAIATRANQQPAVATYVLDPAAGIWRGLGIHVLTVRDGKVVAVDAFLDSTLVPRFGLAATLPT